MCDDQQEPSDPQLRILARELCDLVAVNHLMFGDDDATCEAVLHWLRANVATIRIRLRQQGTAPSDNSLPDWPAIRQRIRDEFKDDIFPIDPPGFPFL